MPSRNLTVYPIVFILGLLLLGLAVWMWPTEHIFYSLIGATALAVMTSAVVFGRRQAKLDRLATYLIRSGYLPSTRWDG